MSGATLALSASEARRLVLAAQGFTRAPRGAVRPPHLASLAERLGVVQIDSVNALVRSHYLPFFSRLGGYDASALDALAWSGGRQRRFFEYWGHEASLLPLSFYPLMRWRMARSAAGQGIYAMLARFGRERQDVIQRVLQAIRTDGASGAGALSTRTERAGPWWDWSDEKNALEWLFAAGEVTVAGRRGFERLYDLPERVIPAQWLNTPEPTPDAAMRALLLHAARALGVATEKDLRDYFRLEVVDARRALAELVEAGELLPTQVRGWTQPAYCAGEPVIPRRVRAAALLSPFDSLIWERSRTERLFGFHYRLELYTPADRRRYGYYVLPFLLGDRLVARVDLRADRQGGSLKVLAVHEEPGGLPEPALAELGRCLVEMASWLGLDRVDLACVRPVSQGLGRWLQA